MSRALYQRARFALCLTEAAEDGTLSRDEIGELSLALQAKLLNILGRWVGSTKARSVLARFVAATDRDLQQMMIEGLSA